MDKPARYKSKNKKPAAKPKTTKKKKQSDGPTCSMFLVEMSRKLAAKRKQEEESSENIVQTIINSLTNALPVIFSKKPSEINESHIKMETLQKLAPELMPNDKLAIPNSHAIEPDNAEELIMQEVATTSDKMSFKMPKMPVVNSEVLKVAVEKRKKHFMHDVSINTNEERDMASELAKHVNTLKKISLIAEEFNKKTAKNLKEIVDSVQEELLKKLEEINAEQKTAAQATQAQEEINEDSESSE
ncbi:Uncharacterized protein OBRU01_09969 [Operophtera brumata]|uniref:Uncharacterized protein n=1 Tax=Operophtera brumata TaxID=104452 RepID=A0A0L7LF77_OPEBR|nr:Uncharacterized protein OBRU01_09969 [Operophtera brumata]